MIPKTPPVTMTLVGVSIFVYLLMTIIGQNAVALPLMISGYLQPVLPEIKDGQVWRLITPIFLHFSIFHIVFNMLWTWEFGRLIEWRQGPSLLVSSVLFIAVASNLAQYYVSGPVFGGMSGVVYGLFGYCWIQSMTNPYFGIQLNPTIVKLLLGWFIICWTGILEKIFGIGIANTAHTAGLISGILAALVVSGFIRLKNPSV